MYRGRHACAFGVVSLLLIADCASHPAPIPAVAAATVTATPADGADDTAAAAELDEFSPPRPDPATLEVAWAKQLPALAVECANTGARADVRLYEADGTVDPLGVDTFSLIAADSNGVYPLNPRVVRLAVKAAHHFDAKTLVVVSAYRKPRTRQALDHHSKGEALDFKLPGVDYKQLAAYLRSLPRVGVGVYTDPRTRYVHLDVRDRSFHWLDASPPGVTWREAPLPDPRQALRDATYSDESDLPLDHK
jgi:hypothetical protein